MDNESEPCISRLHHNTRLDIRLSLLAYGTVLIYLSLFPWTFDFSQPFRHPLLRGPLTPGEMVDSVLNVAIYIPLGFLFQRALRNAWGAIACGILLSLTVEYLQIFVPGRDSSWRDVLLNVAGTALGAAAGRLPLVVPPLPRLPPAGLFCAALWFTVRCFPFLPVIRMNTIARLQRTLQHFQWEPISALDSVAAAFILSKLLPGIFAPLALFLPLLLEPVILGRQLQVSACIGAIAGYLVALKLPQKYAAWLALAWIVLRAVRAAAHGSTFYSGWS